MDSFAELVLDQLRGLPAVTWRRMFGGWGFYSAGLFFGVVFDDRLYFKTDEAGQDSYRARGSGPFTYEGGALHSLWEVPADVLEDADELTDWAQSAVAAARAARLKKSPRRKK
ncbi:MAG TPA: TfoX/Sxy family protein [Longimicrobiales bacterium]